MYTKTTVDTAEAAEILGLKPETVRKDCRNGKLPALLQENGRYIIQADDVYAHKAARAAKRDRRHKRNIIAA